MFGDSSLLLFLIDLFTVIALPTFGVALGVALCVTLSTLIVRKSDNFCYHNNWKRYNYSESNTEKKPWTNIKKKIYIYKKRSKEIKNNNHCISKVRSTTTMRSNSENSNMLSQS